MDDKSKELIIVRDYHLRAETLEAGYARAVGETLSKHRELLDRMKKVYFVVSATAFEDGPTKNLAIRDVMHLLLSRAMKNFRSIYVLLSDGLEQDAMAILRNLIETTMTIRYIGADESGERAERFRAYAAIEKDKNLDKNLRVDPTWLPPGHESQVDEIRAAAQAYRDKYGNTMNWHGEGKLTQFAAHSDVDMLKDYVTVYSSFSLFTHPSAQSMSSYQIVVDGSQSLTWAPSANNVDRTIYIAIGYVLKVIEAYKATLGIDSDAIENVVNEARVVLNHYAAKLGYSDLGVTIGSGIWPVLPASLQRGLRKTED